MLYYLEVNRYINLKVTLRYAMSWQMTIKYQHAHIFYILYKMFVYARTTFDKSNPKANKYIKIL